MKKLVVLLCALLALGSSAQALEVSAPSALLMEKETGTVLFAKDEHAKLEPASVTKVMTLLLTMEAIDAGQLHYDDVVTASAHACSMGGSQIWLKENEQMTVSDMLKAVCVVSANDCAVALAETVAGSEEAFVERMNQRAAELGMTMDQTLTLASMIEKEAKKADFAKVSAVFHNRLNSGMKLQSDPTIHYVTGQRRMALRSSDLQVDSPYNTYIVSGLPLGPICNPSPEAIYAALYPDESYVAEKYLYFCSKDPNTGELYFSKTLEEHNQAVSIYSPLWQAYDQERGI